MKLPRMKFVGSSISPFRLPRIEIYWYLNAGMNFEKIRGENMDQTLLIKVNAMLSVDDETANLCLTLLNLYCNNEGLMIDNEKRKDGKIFLSFKDVQ